MMYIFVFTKNWEKEFKKLSKEDQNRIIKKLKNLKTVENIYYFLKKLENFQPYTHRLRVWNIRLLLKKENETTFYVLNVWYRWDIYK